MALPPTREGRGEGGVVPAAVEAPNSPWSPTSFDVTLRDGTVLTEQRPTDDEAE